MKKNLILFVKQYIVNQKDIQSARNVSNRAFIVINDANIVNKLIQSVIFKERFRQIAMQEQLSIQ